MLSTRRLPFFAVFLAGVAVSPAGAMPAGKLLPADTKVIVSLNLRQLLSDQKNTEFVQRFLDQFRLALKGDEEQLKKYYKLQELHKSEGISEQEFLARSRAIKSFSDTFGIDPLKDIELITLGLRTGKEAGFFVVIVEGRFQRDKFKAGIEQNAKETFGSFKLLPGGNVWQVPDAPGGACVSLLDARTVAITDGQATMTELLTRAGKKQGGLTKGMLTLLDHARKEHLGIVLADVDRHLNELMVFLKEKVAKSIGPNDLTGKFIVTQGAEWIQKYGSEISSAGLGLSLREDDLQLHFGVDIKKTAIAKELHGQILKGHFWSVLALKAINTETTQQLATILIRQQINLRETTLSTQFEVPYDFIKLVLKGPWLVLLSKDFAPAGPAGPLAALSQSAMDVFSTRVTSIPLWSVPARDSDKPLPAGTFEVQELLNVAYRSSSADPVRHRLDMYLPKNTKDFPVVVLVHGGAWIVGDNRCAGLYSSVGQFLASQGIGVVMPNYRLSPSVKHPEHVKDLAQAVAWTRANIGKHGGDTQRFYLAGHSAGAHLVSLLATDESYLRAEGLKTSDIKGVIAVSGVYKVPPGVMRFSVGGTGPRAMQLEQMFPARGDSPPIIKLQVPGLPAQLNMFAPVFGDTPDDCANASPVTHVRKGLPPFLILSAEHDLPTLAEMADEFHQALRREGCEARLLKFAKRNHNSLIFSVISPEDPAAQAILAFIRK